MPLELGTEWIAEAYDAWLGALDEASGFAPGIESAGVTHVILLGLAQHGKTTLALRLLEAISPDAIGKALRGGRLQGQSATPGPLGYYACEPSATLDGPAITQRMVDIFEAYAVAFDAVKGGESRGKAFLRSLPEISIPSRNPTCPFKIVDMAGFDGRETWAEVAAGYWTARADYTILVIQAEKISQLMGEDFRSVIAQFKNRWTHSDSMLVVTTASFEQKPDPAEEGLDWEAISERRRDQFHRDVLSDSAIARDKIELFPVSLRPGDCETDDPLTQESLARLKARLSGPTLLTRLSNAEILHRDRVESLRRRREGLEREMDRHSAHLAGIQAADDDARKAAETCATFIRDLSAIKSVHYSAKRVDENTWHDTYKVQEPRNAFQFHADRLAEYQGSLKEKMEKFHDKFNFIPLDELVTCLSSCMHFDHLTESLRDPISDADFKKEKRSILSLGIKYYDETESGKALHQKMTERERDMVAEVERCGDSFRARITARTEEFASLLNAFRGTKEQELAQCREEASKVEEALRDLDRRQEALPPIPDLAVGLKATFTKAWNGLITKANETELNTEALACLFLEQWAMKESLSQVAARFYSEKG